MSLWTSVQNGAGLERVHYFPRQLITANDMTAEQDYFRQKQRRHNRFLHGWGVVYGLEVNAAATPEKPWQVSITCGYALSPQGDEIYVAQTVCYDLVKCGPEPIPNPCEPGGPPLPGPNRNTQLYVAIRYVECETRPVRVHPAGCGCDEMACEYSRIRDDFQIGCLTEPPSLPPVDPLCNVRHPPCLPCPEELWVVLAQVTLPSSPETNITQIDNFTPYRRQLYSTAMLQEQVIACCCEGEEPPPARLLQVGNVRILRQNNDLVFDWNTTQPLNPDQIEVGGKPSVIEVVFSGGELNPATVSDGETFIVQSASGAAVHGTFATGQPPNVVRWTRTGGNFTAGVYRVTLVGGAEGEEGDQTQAIKSISGSRLDGDRHQVLPSGNDEQGGNFIFSFKVSDSTTSNPPS